MIRRILSILFLLGLAVAVWVVARWSMHRNDLRATVVFDSATKLSAGDPVESGGQIIGRVTSVSPLERGQAVSIGVEQKYRREVLSDSVFSFQDGKPGTLRVSSVIAVGRPLEDGAVVRAKEDRLSRWITRHGDRLEPLLGELQHKANAVIEQVQEGKLDDELERIRERIPEWQKEGDAQLKKRLAQVAERIDKLEESLRRDRKDLEADRLRSKFDAWIERIRKERRP